MRMEQLTFIKEHIDTMELEKITIKDRSDSNYMDLMKFTGELLQVQQHGCHHVHHDKINLTQLNQFRNLLTAGDVSTMKTVYEDNNIHQWLKMVPKMAYSSSVALHAWMVTGIKPVNIKKRISEERFRQCLGVMWLST